jgi:hypothetical protein
MQGSAIVKLCYLLTAKLEINSVEHEKNLPWYFLSKFNSHYNAKFKLLNMGGSTSDFTAYYTYNSTKPKFLFDILLPINNKIQYLNGNYILFAQNGTEHFLRASTRAVDIEVSKRLEASLLGSNDIPMLERHLNMGIEFYKTCICLSGDVNNCFHHLIITHGDHAQLIFDYIHIKG